MGFEPGIYQCFQMSISAHCAQKKTRIRRARNEANDQQRKEKLFIKLKIMFMIFQVGLDP